MKNISKERGLIGMLVLILIGLILLKYFLDFSVFEAAKTEQGQETISYSHQLWNTVWSVISAPVIFVWSKIVWPILHLAWESFQAFLVWGHANAEKGI